VSGQELGKSRLNELLITGSWVRVPAGSPSNTMQSEGGTALPSSQKIGLCRDLKERNPKRAGGRNALGAQAGGVTVHQRVSFSRRERQAAPKLARHGCCCRRRCYGRVHSATEERGRLYGAQAHRHRCNCSDPCNGGSGTTGRRDDGDNAEPVARGDYCGQSRTGRVASPSSLAPALLALVFSPVLAAATMGLALAPSPVPPPPCTARDRESSQQARRTGHRDAIATQSASS